MRMRRAVFLALTCALCACVPRSALVAAQPAPTWFGNWTYNAGKSSPPVGPLPFKRATCRIEPWRDGVRVVYDLVRVRGGITHLEWVGKVDGRDYAVQGVDAYVTNAYQRVDDRTFDIVQKVDGNAAVTARMTLSPDGATLTTITPGASGQSTTTVFDRQ